MKNSYWFILAVFLLLFSCKKAEDRSCWKSSGAVDTLVYTISDFDSLRLHEKLNFELVQSNQPKLEIIGGENLINHVKLDSLGDVLSISNANKCAFLRSYKEAVKVRIHLPTLRYIYTDISEELSNEGVLTYPNLFLLAHSGAGRIDLNVDANRVFLDASYGNVDFNLSGQLNSLGLSVKSNAYGDTRDLKVKYQIEVFSNTVGDLHINAENTNLVKAELIYKGDVYLYGTPIAIEKTIEGEGSLIEGN